MSILRPHSKAIGDALQELEARLHPSYLMLGDALEPVIAAANGDPATYHVDAARRDGVDDAQHLSDAPALIAQARDLEAIRAQAAAPQALEDGHDAAWWAQQIQQARRRSPVATSAQVLHARGTRYASELLGMPVAMLERSEAHWGGLLGLPGLIGEGTAEEAAAWVSGPLAFIDPEMAEELQPDDPVRRALFDETDGLLTCMTYLNMMVEAVPSGVYAHMAGPGAVHLPAQLVRMVVGSFLGSRVASLQIYYLKEHLKAAWERMPAKDPLATAAKELALHLDQFTTAAIELHQMGELLIERRAGWSGMAARGLRNLLKR